jgi:hypothetical protein
MRKLLLVAVLLFSVTSTMTWTACSLTNVLAEGEKILSYMPLAVNIALPLVCIDVAICPAATLAAKAFDAGQTVVLQLFQQWQAASTAAQPGFLVQLQAAIGTLNGLYTQLLAAFHVVNSELVGVVGGVLAAIQAAIGQIATLTGAVLGAGGTALAMQRTILVRSVTLKELGPVTNTSGNFKAAVLRAVKVKTGDAGVNLQLAALQAQVKGW